MAIKLTSQRGRKIYNRAGNTFLAEIFSVKKGDSVTLKCFKDSPQSCLGVGVKNL